jgi:hypothetical protein
MSHGVLVARLERGADDLLQRHHREMRLLPGLPDHIELIYGEGGIVRSDTLQANGSIRMPLTVRILRLFSNFACTSRGEDPSDRL